MDFFIFSDSNLLNLQAFWNFLRFSLISRSLVNRVADKWTGTDRNHVEHESWLTRANQSKHLIMQIIESRWIRRKREIENWESRQRFVVNPCRRSRYYLMHLSKLECSDTEIRSIPRSWRCSRNSRGFKTDSALSNYGAEEEVKVPSTEAPEIIMPVNSR